MKRLISALFAALLVLTAAACSSGGDGSQGGSGGGSGGSTGGGTTQLTVFAASSLTEAFDKLKTTFEKSHPGVQVVASYDSSTTLADQIAQGAPADVIATADETSISTVAEQHLLTAAPKKFATNTLIIATPPQNPAHIAGLTDLAHATYVVCDPSVPCGAAAQQVLKNAGVTNPPKSLEPDVKSVLAKVTLGQSDAGLVYVSDATTAGASIRSFPIPSRLNVINPYFIGVVSSSPHVALAQQWVSLVASQAGQAALKRAGFGPP